MTQKDEESAVLMDKKIRGMAYLFEIPVIDLPENPEVWFAEAMQAIEQKLGWVRISVVEETDYTIHAVG